MGHPVYLKTGPLRVERPNQTATGRAGGLDLRRFFAEYCVIDPEPGLSSEAVIGRPH